MTVANPARAILLSKVSEKAWLATVRDWARHGGFLTYHTTWSFRSPSGFPDCVFVRPSTGEIIYAELKTERGKVSAAQQQWIDALAACGQVVFVWRPSDELVVRKMLTGV